MIYKNFTVEKSYFGFVKRKNIVSQKIAYFKIIINFI